METLGRRLAALRARRRITQDALADQAGVSVDIIRKLEQGRRQSARLDTLVRLARALDVPVAEVMGKTPGLVVPSPLGSEVFGLRQAILTTRGDDTAAVEVDLPDLWGLYWSGRYTLLAQALPPALGAARAAVGAGGRGAWGVLAQLLQLAAALLAHLAYEDLAHVALDKATAAAEHADDVDLHAAQVATRVWVLARQGLWDEAEHVAVTAAGEVEPQLSRAGTERLAVWGELLRYGCTAMARAGRRSEAEEMLRMVQAAASAIGDRRPALGGVVSFGPTIAGMAAVGIAVATDEPRRALELAEQVPDISAAPIAVQARYLLNVAYAQAEDWRSAAAVETLRRAESLAPESVAQQTIARAVVAELLPRRSRERLPGLVTLAERIGVPVE
jgi:transcriptional regulator with XRE-family HTH domain